MLFSLISYVSLMRSFFFKGIKKFDKGFHRACPDTKYVIQKPLVLRDVKRVLCYDIFLVHLAIHDA